MAKSKSTKSVAVVNNLRGGGSIQDQIKKLEKSMKTEDVKAARALAGDESKSAIIRLAFKLLPKASTRALVLSKREQAERARIVKMLGEQAGETWEAGVLKEKAEKRSA